MPEPGQEFRPAEGSRTVPRPKTPKHIEAESQASSRWWLVFAVWSMMIALSAFLFIHPEYYKEVLAVLGPLGGTIVGHVVSANRPTRS